jgi:prevent-host-death family protein
MTTTQTVTLKDAQARLAELLTLAQAGNEIIIAANGQPLARLVSIAEPKRKRRIAGLQRGKIWTSDDFDAPLPDEFWTNEK